MKVTVLGSEGWIPQEDETCCFMVEEGSDLILLDAGTGVSNLRFHRDVLDAHESIHVALSHYHLDHVAGLIYLLPYVEDKRLRICGPGEPAYDRSTRQILEDLLQPCFFSRSLMRFSDDVACRDYGSRDFQVGDVSFRVSPQVHTASSFRFILNDRLIYATDTMFRSEDWQGSCDGIVLLHECWDVHAKPGSRHTSVKSLLAGLPDELRGSTYLIHKNPEWTSGDYDEIRKMLEGTGIELARDGMVIEA